MQNSKVVKKVVKMLGGFSPRTLVFSLSTQHVTRAEKEAHFFTTALVHNSDTTDYRQPHRNARILNLDNRFSLARSICPKPGIVFGFDSGWVGGGIVPAGVRLDSPSRGDTNWLSPRLSRLVAKRWQLGYIRIASPGTPLPNANLVSVGRGRGKREAGDTVAASLIGCRSTRKRVAARTLW